MYFSSSHGAGCGILSGVGEVGVTAGWQVAVAGPGGGLLGFSELGAGRWARAKGGFNSAS